MSSSSNSNNIVFTFFGIAFYFNISISSLSSNLMSSCSSCFSNKFCLSIRCSFDSFFSIASCNFWGVNSHFFACSSFWFCSFSSSSFFSSFFSLSSVSSFCSSNTCKCFFLSFFWIIVKFSIFSCLFCSFFCFFSSFFCSSFSNFFSWFFYSFSSFSC